MFSPFANFDDKSINKLILLGNPIEIRRKMQAKSALDFTFQGIIRSATIAVSFLVAEARQVRQTARKRDDEDTAEKQVAWD